MLWDNKFAISVKKIPTVLFITIIIIFLTPFSILERLFIHPRIRKTDLEKPPIFILGHWRSGTTHLHNLFTKDTRLAYPNMIDALFPNHNILTNWLLRPIMSLALPNKRPMDNMKLNVDVPGEHDWAISNLCLISPYSGAYFPNNWSNYEKYANFDDATLEEKQAYKDNLRFYLKKLTYKYDGRQLILKSPMDTARVKLLKEIFPNAKFVHIYRNPYEVFFSTKKLHRKNKDIYPLQEDNRNLDEFVMETYVSTFEAYFDDIKSIPESDLIEISYEKLTDDRVGTLREVYEHLDLPNFGKIEPDIRAYVESVKNYQPDEYVIPKEYKEQIYDRWKFTIDKWGYDISVKN